MQGLVGAKLRRLSWSRAIALTAALGASLVLGACSLEGLDRFPYTPCNADGVTGCEGLNTRDGIAEDACDLWQCDGQGRFCSFGRRDHDGDGHIAAMCSGGDDCDDFQRTAFPGAQETCDGADNDCNGLIDDTTGSAAQAVISVVTGAPNPSFLTIADAEDGVFLAWRSGPDTRTALVTSTTPATSNTLLGSTTGDPFHSATVATAESGCPGAVFQPGLSPPCEAGDPPCMAPTICVAAPDGSHVCEHTIVHRTIPPTLPHECQTNAECSDGIFCNGIEQCDPNSSITLIDHDTGCRPATTPPCGTGMTCVEELSACVVTRTNACSFTELAVAPLDAIEFMTAAVTTGTCARGDLRPGLVSMADSPPADILWGDTHFTTTWLGVDVDGSGCTGAHRAAADARGASGASIATLPRDPVANRNVGEALAAWRAAEASAASSPVEIIGLWREESTAGSQPIRFVNGTGNGLPVRLTDATTSAHIGLDSFASGTHAGFVVAYARAGGGISVSVVAAMDGPSPICGTPPCINLRPGADGSTDTPDDENPVTTIPSAAGVRATASLAMPVTSVLDMSTTVIGDVTVGVGAIAAGATSIPIALAWATASDITIAQATIDATTGVLTDGARLHVTVAGAQSVRLVHAEAGVSLAGQFASGTITAGERGGFVVTWTTGAGTFAARVSDHTHQLIGAVRLGEVSDAPRAYVDYDAMTSSPTLRVAAHQGDAFVVFPSVCGPSGS